ncbi:hypothetical protein GGF37_003151, partial [Kickxella alabastrina]
LHCAGEGGRNADIGACRLLHQSQAEGRRLGGLAFCARWSAKAEKQVREWDGMTEIGSSSSSPDQPTACLHIDLSSPFLPLHGDDSIAALTTGHPASLRAAARGNGPIKSRPQRRGPTFDQSINRSINQPTNHTPQFKAPPPKRCWIWQYRVGGAIKSARTGN